MTTISRQIGLFLLVTFFSTAAFGQTDTKVFLKWKLQPGEILTYKTGMQNVDLASGEKEKTADAADVTQTLNKILSESVKEVSEQNDLLTKLTEKRKGIIDIEMSFVKKDLTAAKNNDGQEKQNSSDLAKMVTPNVMLRGAVYDNGSIESFYTTNNQKNLIALLFELPNKDVKVGDSWMLDVNLISMDQNFVCNSSSKQNKVTLVELRKVGGDTVAVIKYNVSEFVSGDFNNLFADKKQATTMKIDYGATAEFSLEKGRWLSYNGVMSTSASGFMKINSATKFALVSNLAR